MRDPIARSLDLLADGLRPYIAARAQLVLRRDIGEDLTAWDAQQLLLFMWERWNDLFRGELSFVERSLVSELREFRNRWAHQSNLSERDIYRVLDSAERLLHAINSPCQKSVAELRCESLNRLWQDDVGSFGNTGMIRVLWPYLLCGASAVAIGTALVTFVSSPWSWILSVLVLLATMRIAWMQSQREAHQGPGPRECSHCGRIIYSSDCPYCCRAARERTEAGREAAAPRPSLAGSWTTFRLPGQALETRPSQGSRTVPAARDGNVVAPDSLNSTR